MYLLLDKDKIPTRKDVWLCQKLCLRCVTVFLLLTSVMIHKHIIRTALCVLNTGSSSINYPHSPDVCNLFRNIVWSSPGSSDMNITMKTYMCYCCIYNSTFAFNAFVHNLITTFPLLPSLKKTQLVYWKFVTSL